MPLPSLTVINRIEETSELNQKIVDGQNRGLECMKLSSSCITETKSFDPPNCRILSASAEMRSQYFRMGSDA
ncbi:hypothetical protein Tco_1256726 [Tanacetum coccineum]